MYTIIEKCLDWNPETRITPEEALNHEWIIDGIAMMHQAVTMIE